MVWPVVAANVTYTPQFSNWGLPVIATGLSEVPLSPKNWSGVPVAMIVMLKLSLPRQVYAPLLVISFSPPPEKETLPMLCVPCGREMMPFWTSSAACGLAVPIPTRQMPPLFK